MLCSSCMARRSISFGSVIRRVRNEGFMSTSPCKKDTVRELLDVPHLGDRNLAQYPRKIAVAVVLEMGVEIHVLQGGGDLLAHGIVQQVDAHPVLVLRLDLSFHNKTGFTARAAKPVPRDLRTGTAAPCPTGKRAFRPERAIRRTGAAGYFHSTEARTAAGPPSPAISNSAERSRSSQPTASV